MVNRKGVFIGAYVPTELRKASNDAQRLNTGRSRRKSPEFWSKRFTAKAYRQEALTAETIQLFRVAGRPTRFRVVGRMICLSSTTKAIKNNFGLTFE